MLFKFSSLLISLESYYYRMIIFYSLKIVLDCRTFSDSYKNSYRYLQKDNPLIIVYSQVKFSATVLLNIKKAFF